MSATLGASARSRWLGQPIGKLSADNAVPYPAVWTGSGPSENKSDTKGKKVSIKVVRDWSARQAATLAAEAALQGARVLVIRNTVDREQDTFEACVEHGADLMFHAGGIPMLHHSRFTAPDRLLLDRAVEAHIGKDSRMAGRIVIGT
ncbi:MAG: hypothetical protein HWE26_22835 [Alteromonadaceae bacterium]|nr:hypothetical protein [Alteromonadaceae bacterium]